MEIRETKLKLEKRVYLTLEAYKILRKQKKEQSKSMAEIACDLITDTFKD